MAQTKRNKLKKYEQNCSEKVKLKQTLQSYYNQAIKKAETYAKNMYIEEANVG